MIEIRHTMTGVVMSRLPARPTCLRLCGLDFQVAIDDTQGVTYTINGGKIGDTG
jgi:hypothetical protein